MLFTMFQLIEQVSKISKYEHKKIYFILSLKIMDILLRKNKEILIFCINFEPKINQLATKIDKVSCIACFSFFKILPSVSWFYACFQEGKETQKSDKFSRFELMASTSLPSQNNAKIRFLKFVFLHKKIGFEFARQRRGKDFEMFFFRFFCDLEPF